MSRLGSLRLGSFFLGAIGGVVGFVLSEVWGERKLGSLCPLGRHDLVRVGFVLTELAIGSRGGWVRFVRVDDRMAGRWVRFVRTDRLAGRSEKEE